MAYASKNSPDMDTEDTPTSLGVTSVDWKYPILFLGSLVALAVFVSGTYSYMKVKPVDILPAALSSIDSERIIVEVSKLLAVPIDERPTIATVSDPSKLSDQPFFANAKKGDIVLIYPKARQAILYDRVAGRLVEVAKLGVDSPF